jgi:hypothetical protein
MDWRALSPAHARAGALPPLGLHHCPALARSLPPVARGYAARWRLIEAGHPAIPGDCPAIRTAAAYGWAVRAPTDFSFARAENPTAERLLEPGSARFQYCRLTGVPDWPDSDSGLVPSWIAGADHIKIQTGIVVRLPPEYALFQGPLPFGRIDNPTLNPLVATGIEIGRAAAPDAASRLCELNVIARLPTAGEEVSVKRGQSVGWFFLVPRRALAPEPQSGPEIVIP